MSYGVYSTDEFDNAIRKLERVDQKRVSGVIDNRICENPYHNSKALTGDVYEGLRSFRIGKQRIIFLIAEEVRKKGLAGTSEHLDCTGIPDEGIKLLYVGPRKDVYRWSP